MTLLNNVYEKINAEKFTGILSPGFKNALNTVEHDVLLERLGKYRISNNELVTIYPDMGTPYPEYIGSGRPYLVVVNGNQISLHVT